LLHVSCLVTGKSKMITADVAMMKMMQALLKRIYLI
jgi:hypothetical protein